LVD
jgi:hypothetical protein